MGAISMMMRQMSSETSHDLVKTARHANPICSPSRALGMTEHLAKELLADTKASTMQMGLSTKITCLNRWKTRVR